jgi:hypothetical protein
MRVSHEDRDRVSEALRVAAGDGRLSMEELEERLEQAMAARTYADLEPLVSDLPGLGGGALAAVSHALAAPAAAKDLVRVKRRGGSLKYEGVWHVPKAMDIDLRGGSVLLDFTAATVSAPLTKVNVDLRGGSLRVIVPPGFSVDANEVELHGGSVRNRVAADSQAATAVGMGIGMGIGPTHRIEVTGAIRGGSVVIKPPRGPKRRGWLRRLFSRSGD